MIKRYIFVLLMSLVVLPIQADDHKKKAAAQPDSVPEMAQEVEGSSSSLIAPEDSDANAEDNDALNAIRHNLNTVALADTGTWLGRVQHGLDSLCNIGIFETTQLGLYVYDITANADVYAVNHQHRMRPASCEKVVTAISALNFLGGNYKLNTRLRITGEVKDSVLQGDVYVIGGMDPVLAQGDVYQLAIALRNQGIDSIAGRIYTDLSFKDKKEYGWGWCWDDKWGPLRVLTVDGKDRFAKEFVDDIKSVGIKMDSTEVTAKNCPGDSKEVRVIQHTIDQVLLRMMKNSNNIYAESLFYQLAAHSGQTGSGRKQAVGYINNLIGKVGLKPSRYQIADGSGLSLYNYLTPELLVKMLVYAWNDEKIRGHLYPSLPIAGVDGTLSKRMRGTLAQGNVHAKTGTVEGISSLSGYATSTEGHVLAFSIINQGIIHTSTGKDFQNKVCRLLCETKDPKAVEQKEEPVKTDEQTTEEKDQSTDDEE